MGKASAITSIGTLLGMGVLSISACRKPSGEHSPSSSMVASSAAPSSTTTSPPAPRSSVTIALPAESAPPEMILVPAGTFTMGADKGGEQDEHPAHQVTLSAFMLDRTHVTNEAYGECVAARACRAPNKRAAARAHAGRDADFEHPRQPVVGVSWDDAKTYCSWVHKRLPREAEMERAMRGDDARLYPWGNDLPTPDRAVFGRRLGLVTSVTDVVDSHPRGRGPFGHEDLTGNAWQWCEDEYDPYAYRRPTADRGIPGSCSEILTALRELKNSGKRGFTGTNPTILECQHVLRGGAFNYAKEGLRATNRVHHPGRFRLIVAGFRCAKDP